MGSVKRRGHPPLSIPTSTHSLAKYGVGEIPEIFRARPISTCFGDIVSCICVFCVCVCFGVYNNIRARTIFRPRFKAHDYTYSTCSVTSTRTCMYQSTDFEALRWGLHAHQTRKKIGKFFPLTSGLERVGGRAPSHMTKILVVRDFRKPGSLPINGDITLSGGVYSVSNNRPF